MPAFNWTAYALIYQVGKSKEANCKVIPKVSLQDLIGNVSNHDGNTKDNIDYKNEFIFFFKNLKIDYRSIQFVYRCDLWCENLILSF